MSHRSNSSSLHNGCDTVRTLGESSSCPHPPRPNYDVFLSFRGETALTFTNLLYSGLVKAAISVFKDKGLSVGENSENELLKAMEASKISILIISCDYTSSESCLKELVQILKCNERFGRHVLPVFYQVNPSDVQKQLDDVSDQESQECKERRHDIEYGGVVQEWKNAHIENLFLTQLQSEKFADWSEEKFVEMVVAKVLKKLGDSTAVVSDRSVGVVDHVKKNNMVNEEGSNDGPSNSSQLTSSQGGIKYDVFLSFRGPDTRRHFADFLYHELLGAGIHVYMDRKELLPSAHINQSLMEAIENSTIAVPIFSKDYASSKSCLRELGRIYECSKRVGQIIVPIFYYIEPSDVRHQTGTFKMSFHAHQESRVCPQDLEHWKMALKAIGDLKGYHVRSDVYQSELVKEIVSHIIKLLNSGNIDVPEYLVGMPQYVQPLVEKLQVSSKDVRILGICGTPGIGKTTLARVVYGKLCRHYEHYAILSNSEGSSEDTYSLQSRLISQLLKPGNIGRSIEENRWIIRHRFEKSRVLIVLDNVESSDQVNALVGDPLRFGPGSRILVTARTETVIPHIEGNPEDVILHMEPLNDSDTLKLFCWHAFGRDFPEGEYHEMSEKIASNTLGNPRVIKAVGGYLYRNRDREIWKETLLKLKNAEHGKLDVLLSECYEKYLDKSQQQIFLDIACFLEGKSKSIAHHMWAACLFYPKVGVKTLLQLSLLKIGENDELLMDNPVQNFGKKRVAAEHENRESRSRLWSHYDALEVLKGKKGTQKIQALCLKFDSSLTRSLTSKSFIGLPELRFLRLDKAKITGNFKNLLPNLKWLDMKDCSGVLEDLKNLSLEELVILDISRTNIKHDWQGWRLIMEKAKDLKVLVLASCDGLQGSPPFTNRMRLERLSFENCPKLRRINMVSNALAYLVYLNLKGCTEVNVLPQCSLAALEELIIDGTDITEINAGALAMKNVETLSASGCKKLTTIDNSIGNSKSLVRLMLDDTAIKELPSSIGSLTNLQNLSLRNCGELDALPESVGKLSSLNRMNLSGTAIKELPPSVKHLKLLKILLMRNTHIEEFPKSITKLEGLEEIDFSLCRCMKGTIPNGITNLSSLTTLSLSATMISRLPQDISGLSRLRVLKLWECEELKDLPHLPTSLTTLHVGSPVLKKIPELSNMNELIELCLADYTVPDPLQNDGITGLWPANSFQWIPDLPKLETLRLHVSKITELPVNFSVLDKLRELYLSCQRLQSLPKLPPKLTNLHLQYCRSMTEYENLSVLTSLSELEVDHCGRGSINLENLRELRILKIYNCCLEEIYGIEELHHIRELTMSHCSIQRNLLIRERHGTEVALYDCENVMYERSSSSYALEITPSSMSIPEEIGRCPRISNYSCLFDYFVDCITHVLGHLCFK